MLIGNDYRMPNAATVNKSVQSAVNDAGGTFADIVNQKAAEAETKISVIMILLNFKRKFSHEMTVRFRCGQSTGLPLVCEIMELKSIIV